ncbi:pyridoxamine 5'-phosphate oxidase family protein [Microbacterium sp. NPDC089695]|uniref:pyridoxamine 5'-phosphate oxidase family protein n=1 Tax=Microbacterium sp. NPDC089695 TaxID=3364198 RepID=UPI003823154C
MRHSPQASWHDGEEHIHRILGVPLGPNPTIHGLPPAYGMWMAESPLLALGTTDEDGRVWTTVIGGAAGVTSPIAPGVLAFDTRAQLASRTRDLSSFNGFDPVISALFSADSAHDIASDPEAPRQVEHSGKGKLLAGLALNLEERTRVKLAGRMLKGIVNDLPATDGAESSLVRVKMAVAIDETLGNCPKYLNRKAVWPHDPSPRLESDTLPLPEDAVALISRADIIFISSRHGSDSMDTNNRGGTPGFVRVATNSAEEGVTLVYPEYSGNRLYQSLGNLASDAAIGVAIPDFETGDILHLSGVAQILVGSDAEQELPHSRLAVRITVHDARFVREGLPFRGQLLDPSPYNPPVRALAREIEASGGSVLQPTRTTGRLGAATLIDRSPITSTIARYTFRFASDDVNAGERAPWTVGQHVTLDFSRVLAQGWSHMRDHDPSSLNDDYIRSFTVITAPQRDTSWGHTTFELIARTHGPVTRLLSLGAGGEPPVRADVLAFDGHPLLLGDDHEYGRPFPDLTIVAGGVGITPVLAAADALAVASRDGTVRILWSLRGEDIALAFHLLDHAPELGPLTTLHVTGGRLDSDEDAALARAGLRVVRRRIQEQDLRASRDHRFIISAGRTLASAIQSWTSERQVTLHSFDY